MILRWSPFKIVSISAVLYPRWQPSLKREISSNGQNLSILSQKVPKFELYKHNDELFNIYYRIYYELLIPILDRLCKLPERKGYKHNDELFKLLQKTLNFSPLKLLSQSQPNFAEMILRWSPFKIVSVSAVTLNYVLLWNYLANLNQTLLKWSLGGPLSKLCPSAPSCIKDGSHY